MKLCNDCDLNYRLSKNKRLLVELTLIQLAQLTAPVDDELEGRSPKKMLTPVFNQKQPASATQTQTSAVQGTSA